MAPPRDEAIILASSILLDFWGKVTPGMRLASISQHYIYMYILHRRLRNINNNKNHNISRHSATCFAFEGFGWNGESTFPPSNGSINGM